MTAPARIPVVIATVPGSTLGDVEVCVRHETWGEVEVDVRPAGTADTWTPLTMLGGKFTTRAS